MSLLFSRSSSFSSPAVAAVATALFCKVKSSLRLFSYAALLIALFMPFQAHAEPQTVNINTASAEKLALVLDGVGMAKAIAIVEHRKRYGNFKQIESVESVKGIGSSTLEKNRSKIVVK